MLLLQGPKYAYGQSVAWIIQTSWFSGLFNDTHTEKNSSNKTPALTKILECEHLGSSNIIDTSNQFFVRGSYT